MKPIIWAWAGLFLAMFMIPFEFFIITRGLSNNMGLHAFGFVFQVFMLFIFAKRIETLKKDEENED